MKQNGVKFKEQKEGLDKRLTTMLQNHHSAAEPAKGITDVDKVL